MNRKVAFLVICVLALGSVGIIGWVAVSSQHTSNALSQEVKDRDHAICLAANKKLLIPLGEATKDAVPRTLATIDALINSAANAEQRQTLEDARKDYLDGVAHRTELYKPFDCSKPLLPQLPR